MSALGVTTASAATDVLMVCDDSEKRIDVLLLAARIEEAPWQMR